MVAPLIPLLGLALLGAGALAASKSSGSSGAKGSMQPDPNTPDYILSAMQAEIHGSNSTADLEKLAYVLYNEWHLPDDAYLLIQASNTLHDARGEPHASYPPVDNSTGVLPAGLSDVPGGTQTIGPTPQFDVVPPLPFTVPPQDVVPPLPGGLGSVNPGPPIKLPPIKLPPVAQVPPQIPVPALPPGVTTPAVYTPPAPPVPPIFQTPPSLPPLPTGGIVTPASIGLPDGAYNAANGQTHYILKSGDYGAKIATKFGQGAAQVPQLVAANPGFDFNTGQPGNDLNIPAGWWQGSHVQTTKPGQTTSSLPAPPTLPPNLTMPPLGGGAGIPTPFGTVPASYLPPGIPNPFGTVPASYTPPTGTPAPAGLRPDPSALGLPKGAWVDGGNALHYVLQSGDYGAVIAKKFGQGAGQVPTMVTLNPGFNWQEGQPGNDVLIPPSWWQGQLSPTTHPAITGHGGWGAGSGPPTTAGDYFTSGWEW